MRSHSWLVLHVPAFAPPKGPLLQCPCVLAAGGGGRDSCMGCAPHGGMWPRQGEPDAASVPVPSPVRTERGHLFPVSHRQAPMGWQCPGHSEHVRPGGRAGAEEAGPVSGEEEAVITLARSLRRGSEVSTPDGKPEGVGLGVVVHSTRTRPAAGALPVHEGHGEKAGGSREGSEIETGRLYCWDSPSPSVARACTPFADGKTEAGRV